MQMMLLQNDTDWMSKYMIKMNKTPNYYANYTNTRGKKMTNFPGLPREFGSFILFFLFLMFFVFFFVVYGYCL